MQIRQQELQEKYDKMISGIKGQLADEKKRNEEKTELIKKRSLEVEGNLQRQISQLNKDIAILNEKLFNTEKTLGEVESVKQTIEKTYEQKIKTSKEKYNIQRAELKSNI